MNPALAGVALAVVLGAVVAASSRNARTAVLGLIVALVGASLIADPIPETLGLASRLVGTVLGGYLLWVVCRSSERLGEPRTGGSRLGWPVELVVAGAAAVVGYGSHGLGAPAAGPALAQAAGFALAALAVAPAINGRDVLRIGIGIHLLACGALLVRVALGGTPGPLEQLVVAGFLAVLGGAVAVIAGGAATNGTSGFELAPDATERIQRLPEAHPAEPR